MGRPRAGHGWTSVAVGGHYEKIFFTDKGKWALTGDAAGWPRCANCRRPYQVAPFGFPVCSTCFFYAPGYLADTDEFWRLTNEKHPLAGYIIGAGFTRSMTCGFLSQLNRVSTLKELRFMLSQQPDWVDQQWCGESPRLGPRAVVQTESWPRS